MKLLGLAVPLKLPSKVILTFIGILLTADLVIPFIPKNTFLLLLSDGNG